MEFLAYSYLCLLEIRHRLECGISTSEALRAYLQTSSCDFAYQLRQWHMGLLRGRQGDENRYFKSPLQLLFVDTLHRGLKGEPILLRLAEVEEEMRMDMEDTLERHLQALPIILLLPLTGLIFPSFILLLLGPLLADLLNRFST